MLHLYKIDPGARAPTAGHGSLGSEDALRRLVDEELEAHAGRYEWLGRDMARNVAWTILLGALGAQLRAVDLCVGDVADFEAAPDNLILRWGAILADQGLIFVGENALGETCFTLRRQGRALITGYLTGRVPHPV